MANAMFGYVNNVVSGTLNAGSAESGLGVTQMQNDRGAAATAWQTKAGVTSSWFTVDAGSSSATWRAFLLARTNLTPAATVRWRVGPATAVIEETAVISLDYSNGSIVTPAGYNFARASSGNYFDKFGVLQSAASNVLRFDYDPASGACLGALKEEQRTNYIRNPRAEGATVAAPIAAVAISSITYSGTTATVNTATAHGLAVNNVVTISGAVPSVYNGTFYVASVPTSTSFTVTLASTPASNATTVGSYTASTRGGAPSNGWIFGHNNGINWMVTGAGTENGIPYIEVRWFGTATAAAVPYINFEATTQIAAVQNQIWTASVFHRLVGGSFTNVSSYKIVVYEFNSSGSVLTSGGSPSLARPSAGALGQDRQFLIYTTTNASVAYVMPRIMWNIPAGATVDFTIRVGAPQCELGYGPSSPILPAPGAPAATTRAADREWVTGLAIDGNTAGISFYASFSAYGSVAEQWFVPISLVPSTGSTFSDMLTLFQSTVTTRPTVAATVRLTSSLYGNYPADMASGPFTEGTLIQMSMGVSAAGGMFVKSKGQTARIRTDPAAFPGVFTVAGVGGGLAYGANPGTTLGVGHVRSVRVYAKRLTDGQLTQLAETGSTLDPATVLYDSGTVPAGVVPGYGQSVVIAGQTYTAQYARCDIADPTNPDGFLNVPLAYAGPVWQPASNIAPTSALGQDSSETNIVTRGGQEYPVMQWRRRRWDVAFTGIRDSEVWPQVMAMDNAARAGGNILFIPNPASATLNQEATFGRMQALADISFPYTISDRRSWRARVTERL